MAGTLSSQKGGCMELSEAYAFFGQARLHENKIKRIISKMGYTPRHRFTLRNRTVIQMMEVNNERTKCN